MARYASLWLLAVSRHSQGRIFASLLDSSREWRVSCLTGGISELMNALGCSRMRPDRAWAKDRGRVRRGGVWWARQDSNLRSIGYEPSALPLSYEPGTAGAREYRYYTERRPTGSIRGGGQRRLDGAFEAAQLLTGAGDDNLVIDIEDDVGGRAGEQIAVLLLDGENAGFAAELPPLP